MNKSKKKTILYNICNKSSYKLGKHCKIYYMLQFYA